MPYLVLRSHEGSGSSRTWEPTDYVFDTGEQAGDFCKNENFIATRRSRTERFKAIRIGLDDPRAWRQREVTRFEDGTYQRPPWYSSYGDMGVYDHIDPDNPTQIRFLRNEEDGMAGRYTSMAPGRFIRNYIGDHVGSSMVDKWCAAMGLEQSTSPLMFAMSPDDIVRVYNEGPHSCMAYKLGDGPFEGKKIHPVAPYGDSDIGVAYITRNGDITARCLVWPDQKIHSRIYGDAARLLERLKENDYIENWNGFSGAKIRQLRDSRQRLILPYIDGDLGVTKQGDDWLVLSDKPHIIAKSPSGGPLRTKCESCGRTDVWLTPHYEDGEDEPQYICGEGC